MKNIIWSIKDLKVIPLIWQLGYRNGLKSGDKPTANEFFEAWARHKDWVEPIGMTEQDLDMICGNLRESGLKVLNTNELKRRIENGKS